MLLLRKVRAGINLVARKIPATAKITYKGIDTMRNILFFLIGFSERIFSDLLKYWIPMEDEATPNIAKIRIKNITVYAAPDDIYYSYIFLIKEYNPC